MKKYFLHNITSSVRLNYDKELNQEQLEVVTHPDGPMLVLAGAGTGKTRTVTYRVAHLINTGISPANILLLTFTNKAAREMMRRVELLIGRNIQELFGGTFHHIGNIILRKHCQVLGYNQGFSILDREDSKELLDICISETGKKNKLMPKGSVLADINSFAKNTEKSIEEVLLFRFPHFLNIADEITDTLLVYESKKKNLDLMDFDDLLSNWKILLLEHNNIKEFYSRKFKHILVDEYQDTNKLQAEIVDIMSSVNRNIMAVGDDAQSIYSFRGANFENILNFKERYPDAKVFNLTINYRSTPEILYLANNSISNNIRQFRKELKSIKNAGNLPYLVSLKDVYQQADFVVQKILDFVEDGSSLNDIAVLYRSHFQSMELQMELQRRNIPFEIRSGMRFFEQAHIKDILSFLKVILNPYDELNWKRTLKLIPGIGNITASKIWENIRKSENPLEAIFESKKFVSRKATHNLEQFLELMKILILQYNTEEMVKPSSAIEHIMKYGYEEYLYRHYPNAEDRIEDINQMARFSMRYKTLESFTSDMSLQSVSGADEQNSDDSREYVILSTVHQAKGLEWNTVFIIGLNEGRFPSARTLRTDDEEEERRLFYVAVTRAKEELYLCYTESSQEWQGIGFVRPSRFIKELPKESYEEVIVELSDEIY